MCVCTMNNISPSHPHCKWIGFGEQKITVAFSLKKKLLLSEEKSKEWKLHKKFCFGNKVSLVINKNRSKISFMYLFSGATDFLPSLRLEVATGVESLRKPCQPAPTWWLQDHHLWEDEVSWENWPMSCSEMTRRLSSTLAGAHWPSGRCSACAY